jgi:crotonobetainyl-CoA:carnitine CoA-transferase CaiB-like acyl-CoA transferase
MLGRMAGAKSSKALGDWITDAGITPNPLADVEDWNVLDDQTLSKEDRAAMDVAISELFASLTQKEAVQESLRRGVDAHSVNGLADVLEYEQLSARSYWTEVASESGTARVPGRFMLSSATATDIGGGTPTQSAVRPNGSAPSDTQARPSGALSGVHVVDFGWALAGSIGGRLLADHGATTIKIESRGRLDMARTTRRLSGWDGNPDANAVFVGYNTSKLSIALNLKKPAAREVMDRLVQWADVVNENFTPGALNRLGYGYDNLQALNDDIILVSSSGFGQTGPMAHHSLTDPIASSVMGLHGLTGWPDREPNGAVVFGDVAVPYVSATAAIAALDYRNRTGKGQHIETAMIEVVAQLLGPALLDYQRNGYEQSRNGNRTRFAAPHGVFPTSDPERWCVIAVQSETEWSAFVEAIGSPEWAERFSTLERRKQAEDELEELVADWTRQHEGNEIMWRLQRLGVPAGLVQNAADLLQHDPQLKGRGFLKQVHHPLIGSFGHAVPGFLLPESPADVGTAPLLGQHTELVCREILGFSPTEFHELEQQGVFE